MSLLIIQEEKSGCVFLIADRLFILAANMRLYIYAVF